jgi:hypothetical protein
MAATKTLATIIAASTSNSAGSSTTGTTADLRTAYGALVTIKLTNGSTPPTVAAQAQPYLSPDGGTTLKKFGPPFVGDLVASSVNEFAVEYPPAAMGANVIVNGNTGQAITCEAFAEILTGV